MEVEDLLREMARADLLREMARADLLEILQWRKSGQTHGFKPSIGYLTALAQLLPDGCQMDVSICSGSVTVRMSTGKQVNDAS